MFRRCATCNNQATKFFVHAVQHLALNMTTPEDRMEGFYCNNCYANRMRSYAESLGLSLVKTQHKCKYCGAFCPDAGALQIHQDVRHSNENEAGTTVLEKKEDKVYKPTDAAGRAKELLEEDSKKWAEEYLVPPADTPVEKTREYHVLDPKRGEKWAKSFKQLQQEMEQVEKHRKEYPELFADKDRVWEIAQKARSKELSNEEKHDQIRALAKEWGIDRLRAANPAWADFVVNDQKLRQEWAKNKPPEIPIDKMLGIGPKIREVMKRAKAGEVMVNGKWKKKRGRPKVIDGSRRLFKKR